MFDPLQYKKNSTKTHIFLRDRHKISRELGNQELYLNRNMDSWCFYISTLFRQKCEDNKWVVQVYFEG